MLIDCDCKVVGNINLELIEILKENVATTNWNKEVFDRHDQYLAKNGGWQGITFPYILVETFRKPFTPEQQNIADKAKPIIDSALGLYPGYEIVRGELSILVPGITLEPHRDGSWFHRACRRIHIPIYTNSQCNQTFEDREYHFRPGMVYEMNNRIIHASYNHGEEPRIHIILDIAPKIIAEYINENKKIAGALVARPVDGKEVE